MANLPAGKPLLVDVTRTGAIYELAGGIDISRVRIRTLTGEEALVDLMKQAGLVRASSGGKLVLGGGRVGDFYSLMPTTSLARATNQFDCTATGACRCKGIEDCRKMQEKHPNCKVVIVDQETGYTYCIEPR